MEDGGEGSNRCLVTNVSLVIVGAAPADDKVVVLGGDRNVSVPTDTGRKHSNFRVLLYGGCSPRETNQGDVIPVLHSSALVPVRMYSHILWTNFKDLVAMEKPKKTY